MKIRFVDYTLDQNDPLFGVEQEQEIDAPELEDTLAAAREEWKRLAEAGTPYWCIHEGRSVTHESAYWQDNQPNNQIHRKHGVRCAECGGYIQEG